MGSVRFLPVDRPAVVVTVLGRDVSVPANASVLSVIAASTGWPVAPREGEPLPGAWCGMGICFGCLVRINGRLDRGCLRPVAAGDVIELDWDRPDA